MLFSSITFIYVFLPIVMLLYFSAHKCLRNWILLLASLVFYGWGEPHYLIILFSIIAINYIGALFINLFRKHKQFILFNTLFFNLIFLFYFKYYKFLIENINAVFHSDIGILHIVMPIGISFYTFQAMSYLIDVYREECKVQKNPFKLALYICLFPQLVAGPIVKYHDIEEQLNSREINFDEVIKGVKRFIIGLSKKVLIANTLAIVVDKIFIQDALSLPCSISWLGAAAYSFQLFFDFSGYSDMAIGLGLIFGFKFMENFNYPYISKSITDFWHRWHISLSTWFKHYIYIPLGGNRSGKLKTARNLLIVFFLTGLWHGAQWTFIIWGLWHGLFIIIEKIINLKDFEVKHNTLSINILRHIYCILIVVIGWVIFRSDNLLYAGKYILSMFGISKPSLIGSYNIKYYLDTMEIVVLIFALMCSTPLFKRIEDVKEGFLKVSLNIWYLLIFIMSTSMIASGTYNPFIYFRF